MYMKIPAIHAKNWWTEQKFPSKFPAVFHQLVESIVLKAGPDRTVRFIREPDINPVRLLLITENEGKTGFNRKPPVWLVKPKTDPKQNIKVECQNLCSQHKTKHKSRMPVTPWQRERWRTKQNAGLDLCYRGWSSLWKWKSKFIYWQHFFNRGLIWLLRV